MPLALNNNRGSVYSGRMKIEVIERKCLTVIISPMRATESSAQFFSPRNFVPLGRMCFLKENSAGFFVF